MNRYPAICWDAGRSGPREHLHDAECDTARETTAQGSKTANNDNSEGRQQKGRSVERLE